MGIRQVARYHASTEQSRSQRPTDRLDRGRLLKGCQPGQGQELVVDLWRVAASSGRDGFPAADACRRFDKKRPRFSETEDAQAKRAGLPLRVLRGTSHAFWFVVGCSIADGEQKADRIVVSKCRQITAQ